MDFENEGMVSQVLYYDQLESKEDFDKVMINY